MRVALYGGSFDPPHVAHVLAVVYLRIVGRFDRVVVVPVYFHAFDKALAPFDERVRMCELAFDSLREVEVSRVEERLHPPSYTLHTIEQLILENPTWRFELVVGSDVLGETHKWHCFERIQELAPLFVLGRQGHPHPIAPPAVLPEVSSSHVRSLLRGARVGAADRELSALVPADVLDYVQRRGLYRCGS
ncbi:MAG: nicotinate-nicotinamide nucleotide adenylyltransferase [Polyangiaceae bacterium]|nr:nicotinate-nicotinamide nucleotide adenylyltransferase [Polyangiaceae bacterium]